MKYFFVIYLSLFLVFLTSTSCGGSNPTSKTEEIASDNSNEDDKDKPKKKKKKSEKQVEEEVVYEEVAKESNLAKKKDYLIGEWELIESDDPRNILFKYIFESDGSFTRIKGSDIAIGDFSTDNRDEITIEYGFGEQYRKRILKVERLNDQNLIVKVGRERMVFKKNE